MLYSAFATLLNRLDDPDIRRSNVMMWAAPIPAFGDISTAAIATVGLNPSNREFVDGAGVELDGTQRRFHTLTSLRLSNWSEADARHIKQMLETCALYFARNPYDLWFKRLDQVISGTSFSFYNSSACHLDLIPYATSEKWTALSPGERAALLSASEDALATLIEGSPIKALILNGRSVVRHFEEMTGCVLDEREMPSWSLKRRGGSAVRGLAYSGMLSELNRVALPEPLLVLGYNHNIQSSYGITTAVVRSIRRWISNQLQKHLP
jgi:hypothetical protein